MPTPERDWPWRYVTPQLNPGNNDPIQLRICKGCGRVEYVLSEMDPLGWQHHPSAPSCALCRPADAGKAECTCDHGNGPFPRCSSCAVTIGHLHHELYLAENTIRDLRHQLAEAKAETRTLLNAIADPGEEGLTIEEALGDIVEFHHAYSKLATVLEIEDKLTQARTDLAETKSQLGEAKAVNVDLLAGGLEQLEQIKKLEADVDEHDQSFGLYEKAIRRGTALWKEWHPDKPLTHPDTGELVNELCETIDRLRTDLARARLVWTHGTPTSCGLYLHRHLANGQWGIPYTFSALNGRGFNIFPDTQWCRLPEIHEPDTATKREGVDKP